MLTKIKKTVINNPNKIAYKINNDFITYKDLWDKAEYYSQLLKRQGTTPIIIYGNKSINVVISILASVMANRAYVPVNLSTPIHRIKQIIELTHSSLVLTDEEFSLDNIECLKLDKLKKYENGIMKEYTNDIVYIIFTSGSTGTPKGVPITEYNLNNFINWISNIKPFCDYKNVNVLNQANFSFDLSVADLYYSLCNNHTLIAYDNEGSLDKLYEIMKEINVAVVTPTFMKLCLLNEEFNEKNYPNLKCVYFCGEMLEVKMTQKLFESFPNLKVFNAYGPTEATSAVSGILITKEMADTLELLPVGEVSTFATEIQIINEEIVLKGKSVFNGYLGNIIGGYYKENNINCHKTGDIGYIKDGRLYCVGRKDSQVKYKGYRIELNDIEYNINLIKGVNDCAVIAKYNDNNIVKLIKAFVVLDNNLDSDYIKNELKKYLPSYMIPKIIVIVDKLPVNQNGKIDRKALSLL